MRSQSVWFTARVVNQCQPGLRWQSVSQFRHSEQNRNPLVLPSYDPFGDSQEHVNPYHRGVITKSYCVVLLSVLIRLVTHIPCARKS